jgi:peptide chain release factor 2
MPDAALPTPPAIPDDDEALLAECRVETFRSGGPGGQHQNVTESGVRLTHLPTGIRVVSREERSQHRNRERALARLREKLEALHRRAKPRRKTKVPRAEKERRRTAKRRRSEAKRMRKRPDPDD